MTWAASRLRFADPPFTYRKLGASNTMVERKQGEEILALTMAERTGLEPATPGVTGRYSNQLNYRSRLGPHCTQM